MLWLLAALLAALWLIGLVTAYTMGGMVHILLAIALVVLAVRLFSGRRAL